MKPKLTALYQIGILATNVEEKVKNYEAMGIGPWEPVGLMTGKKMDLYVNGERFDDDFFKVAMLHKFGMEIEIIEPIGDTPLKRWVDEHGSGIHHLAFETEDDYEDILADYKKTTGKDVWARGQGHGGHMDFSYLDLRDELGIFAEVYGGHQNKPSLKFDHGKEETKE
ncbi:MAG: VOC family protein [Oscillospiraceae bacterium]|nr:VOC family protein [Oscillospiraceae bacterium]